MSEDTGGEDGGVFGYFGIYDVGVVMGKLLTKVLIVLQVRLLATRCGGRP